VEENSLLLLKKVVHCIRVQYSPTTTTITKGIVMRQVFDALEAAYRTEGEDSLKKAIDEMSRDSLQRLCAWNDRNGVWTDEDNVYEFGAVADTQVYRDIVFTWVTEQ